MISNCKVIHVMETEEMPFHLFEATDYSMSCPRQYSIRKGDIVMCEKQDLLPAIEHQTAALKQSDYIVVTSYFEKEFVAKIASVDENKERVTFSFINPDKSAYPDQHLWYHEIRSIYKVKSVQSGAAPIDLKGDAAV